MTPEKLTGLPTTGMSGAMDVTDAGVRLPDEPARFVKLENWPVKNDLVTPNEIDVVWGYHGLYTHWIRYGGNSELIPVNNCSNISLRTRPGESVTVYFSWYK